MNQVKKMWLENEFSGNREVLKQAVIDAGKILGVEEAYIDPYDGTIDGEWTEDQSDDNIIGKIAEKAIELYNERT